MSLSLADKRIMSSIARFRQNPVEFFHYLASTAGFKITPFQENLMKRYFRGEHVDSLMPPPKTDRKVEDLTLEPRKGWTLASLFTEHVVNKHTVYGDTELFDASHVHYRVIGNGHSYHDIVDFRWRMQALAELPGAPGIELVYDEPELLSDERLTSDVMRVLRTIDNDTKYVTEDGGALLSTSCIVDVIKQLHLRMQKQ
jgi:hypothetical protein